MTQPRSPYRVERNPWPRDDHLEESLFLRGAYIAAIGAVEMMLTSLVIAASKEAAYEALRGSFPTRRNARIAYLRKLSSTPGPLRRYQTIIEEVLQRYESATELRDICAHAHQHLYSGLLANAEWEVRFEDWHAVDEIKINHRERRLSDRELRREALRAASFSRAVGRLYFRARALLGDNEL